MSQNKIEDIKQKIENDPDFINSKKHQYSLKRFLREHSSGTTDNIISYFLCIQPSDVKVLYDSAVKKIRQKMNIDVDSGDDDL